MKKTTKLLLTVSVLSSLFAVGCNDGSDKNTDSTSGDSQVSSDLSSESHSNIAERDVNYPTSIPHLASDSIQLHWQRKDNKYVNWGLWAWKKGGDGALIEFNYQDDFGVIASYPLSSFTATSSSTLGFITRPLDGWNGQSADYFVDLTTLEKDENNVFHAYIFEGDKNVYVTPNKAQPDLINSARFTTSKDIVCQTNKPVSHYKVLENGNVVAEADIDGKKEFTASLTNAASIESSYIIQVTFKDSNKTYDSAISVSTLYQTSDFDAKYKYDGELGAIYSSDSTTFRVWSPISSKIVLKLYKNGTPKEVNAEKGSDEVYKSIVMTKGEKGVFETTVDEDLDGVYYTYIVTNASNPNGKEIVDPYARGCGINGLRGMVVNFSKTNPENWDSFDKAINYDRKELTVWETHVADVTSASSWKGTPANAKKFLGLCEEGTKYNDSISSGFDHIKDLGVNAVQLVPIFDQANDETSPTFNWGYNPLNYNCLEGSYSSDPYDGYARIKEFKQVVEKYHEAGINIIMDVVYNHVSGATGSNFDVLMPGYYFRYDGNGNAYNGSGCGNETASENSMMRKFMIDSTEFWAKEYKLGGYRFDLMALHDIETMNQLTANLKEKVNPNIVVYGEPWTGGTSGLEASRQAKQVNIDKYNGFGQFNDQMRDALIKGGLNGSAAKGWITVSGSNNVNIYDIQRIKAGLQGGTVAPDNPNDSGDDAYAMSNMDPNKTVNYVTCHDNYTLYDRISAAGISDSSTQMKMIKLAYASVFSSQGTTFMLAGDEMLRTKGGNSNSYNASYGVNQLDYSFLKIKAVDDIYKNVKALIKFKQDTAALHLEQADIAKQMNVSANDNNTVISYTLSDTDKDYYVILSNDTEGTRSEIDLTGYSLYLDTLGELSTEEPLGKVTPKQLQAIIAYRTK